MMEWETVANVNNGTESQFFYQSSIHDDYQVTYLFENKSKIMRTQCASCRFDLGSNHYSFDPKTPSNVIIFIEQLEFSIHIQRISLFLSIATYSVVIIVVFIRNKSGYFIPWKDEELHNFQKNC